MNADAQRFLAEMVDHARVGPPRRLEGSGQSQVQWARQSHLSFGTALRALRAVGAVDDEELHDWQNRMLVALGHEPVAPLPVVPGAIVSRFIGFGDPPPPIPPPPTARFLRLVPAPCPEVAMPFGGRLQVLGIELYDIQLAVTWRLAPLPDAEAMFADELAAHDRDMGDLPIEERARARTPLLLRLSHRSLPQMEVVDDVGTAYRFLGGGDVGGPDERVGRTVLGPAPPDTASRLLVRWGASECEVPLR